MHEGFEQSFWVVRCVVFWYDREYQVVAQTLCLNVQHVFFNVLIFVCQNVSGLVRFTTVVWRESFSLWISSSWLWANSKLDYVFFISCNEQVKFSVNGL